MALKSANQSKFRLLLCQKIVLLTCGMTVLVAFLGSSFVYHRLSDATIDVAMEGLAGEARLMAFKFQNTYQQMINDISIILHTPPIEGIVRTINDKVDETDGSKKIMERAPCDNFSVYNEVKRTLYTN